MKTRTSHIVTPAFNLWDGLLNSFLLMQTMEASGDSGNWIFVTCVAFVPGSQVCLLSPGPSQGGHLGSGLGGEKLPVFSLSAYLSKYYANKEKDNLLFKV